MSDTRSCEWILLEGRLDADVLADAWNDVVAQHPLLAVRWERDAWHASEAPVLGVRDLGHACDWDALLPLTWDDGAPHAASIDLFRGTEGDAVRIRVPHARTDAWSGAQVAQDLADAYARLWNAAGLGAEGGPAPSRSSTEDDLRGRGRSLAAPGAAPPSGGRDLPTFAAQGPFGANRGDLPLPQRLPPEPSSWDPDALLPLTWGDRWHALRRLLVDVASRAGWSTAANGTHTGPGRTPGAPGAAAPQVGVHLEDLGADALDALRARARAEETSVHVLVTLAVARVCGARRLMDLATVRPLATQDLSRRSDVLVVPWVLHVPDDDAAARTHIRAQVDAVMKQGGARAELARLALYDVLARFLPLRAAMALTFRWITKADVASTNPGPVHVPLHAFGPVGVRDFLNFPHPVPPARRLFAWTTYRGRLRLVVVWRDGRGDLARAQVRALREALGLATLRDRVTA